MAAGVQAAMRGSTSLHRRFIVVLVLSASALALVAAAVSYAFAHRYAVDRAHNSLRALTDAVEKTVAVAVYANDRVLLQELTDGIRKHPLVQRVDVRDAQGRTLGAGDDHPDAAAPPAPDSFQRDLWSPFDSSERLGRLHISVDGRSLLQEARSQASALGLFMVALIAILAFVLHQLALRLLSRPLTQLASELAAMEPGSSNRISLPELHASDEIGVVARATNRLLQAHDDALHRERAAREEVSAMEARYRHIFDISSAGIFVLTPEGELVSSNPTVARLVGSTAQALAADVGTQFIDNVFLNAERARELIAQAVAGRETTSGDLGLRCVDGAFKWAHCLFSQHEDPNNHDHQLIQGVMYDITQRKRDEQAVRRRIHVDPLTELRNRAGILAGLDEAIDVVRDPDAQVTIFYVDLDGFKGVNDRWGHAVGDQVLIECAKRLLALVRRSSDFVGRLGGDEMLMAIRGMAPDSERVQELAAQIVAAISGPVEIGQGRLAQVGASIGVAGFPQHARTAPELLAAADQAMYRAKRSGKGRFVVAQGAPGPARPADAAPPPVDKAAPAEPPASDEGMVAGAPR
ncbi:MAG: diguanylate cyclase [Proteobacteria bacterium]|nr:diguanylate cyclase [Pseudomonadota bacterium]